MARTVDERDPENGPIFTEQTIGDDRSQQRESIDAGDEQVDHFGAALGIGHGLGRHGRLIDKADEQRDQVDLEDGLHAIEAEPLGHFVADDIGNAGRKFHRFVPRLRQRHREPSMPCSFEREGGERNGSRDAGDCSLFAARAKRRAAGRADRRLAEATWRFLWHRGCLDADLHDAESTRTSAGVKLRRIGLFEDGWPGHVDLSRLQGLFEVADDGCDHKGHATYARWPATYDCQGVDNRNRAKKPGREGRG